MQDLINCILFTRDTLQMYQYRGAENGLKGCKTYAMQTDVAILISEKVDFKTRDIIRDKKNSYF